MISDGIWLEDFLFLYVNNWYGIGIYSIKHYICREMKLIERHIKSIAALCRKYKVNRLFVFGSVLTDRFNDGSDIDMVRLQVLIAGPFRQGGGLGGGADD